MSAAKPSPTKPVVIFGASGFIGQHVHQALRDNNFLPRTVPRGTPLQDIAMHVDNTQIAINLAAAGVSPKIATTRDYHLINVVLPTRIVEAMAVNGSSPLIMAGTAMEYGASADQYERVPPDAPLEPITDYGKSKVEGLHALSEAALRCGIDVYYLRIFNAYGVGQSDQTLWAGLRKAAQAGKDFLVSSGEQVRDFIPVGDVAAWFLQCSATHFSSVKKSSPGNVYVRNIGTGHGTSVAEFARFWWRSWAASGQLLVEPYTGDMVGPNRLVADPTFTHHFAGHT